MQPRQKPGQRPTLHVLVPLARTQSQPALHSYFSCAAYRQARARRRAAAVATRCISACDRVSAEYDRPRETRSKTTDTFPRVHLCRMPICVKFSRTRGNQAPRFPASRVHRRRRRAQPRSFILSVVFLWRLASIAETRSSLRQKSLEDSPSLFLSSGKLVSFPKRSCGFFPFRAKCTETRKCLEQIRHRVPRRGQFYLRQHGIHIITLTPRVAVVSEIAERRCENISRYIGWGQASCAERCSALRQCEIPRVCE